MNHKLGEEVKKGRDGTTILRIKAKSVTTIEESDKPDLTTSNLMQLSNHVLSIRLALTRFELPSLACREDNRIFSESS